MYEVASLVRCSIHGGRRLTQKEPGYVPLW
jgi:hypothetical protein